MYADGPEAMARVRMRDDVTEPDAAAARAYDELYAIYGSMYPALRDGHAPARRFRRLTRGLSWRAVSERFAIAQVTPFPWEDDHEVNAFAAELSAELAARGHRMLVLAPRARPSWCASRGG